MERRPLTGEKELGFLARLAEPTGRRTFLKWSGVSVAVMAVGCKDAGPTGTVTDGRGSHGAATINLGSGDIAVLNYAYALEQLEAEFFTQVINNPYAGMTTQERRVLDDIRKHEVIHREFYSTALGGAAIPQLTFDFTAVNFNDRESVLQTARVFEDLGVSAYNGAGQLLENVDFLVIAGKIVSNEARHAAAIRDLLQPRTTFFAGDDVVNEQGLDVVRVPSQVLPLANPFIVGDILDPHVLDASGLPTPGYVPPSPTAPMG
ncbi:hypothetical protein BH24GEM3_BH24GEM3_19610 [soil metagenome]